MAERRLLVEGLKPESNVDPAVERAFVLTGKAKATKDEQDEASAANNGEVKRQNSNPVSRVPLTTRVRTDFAAALKKASLQRQLDGVFPNTLQDILEEALEPWLRSNDYLK